MNENERAYTKAQLYKSEKYAEYRDIISVVLNDDESYTFSEAESLINNFLNKEADC